MKCHMLYVKSRKTFEVELKFDRHFYSKLNCILLKSPSLLQRCFHL